MGVITPLGLDVESTWEKLVQGTSGVDYITAFDHDELEVKFAAEVKGFDPTAYLERKEARRMDRFTQMAAVATKEALAQARLKLEEVDPYRVAVLMGSGIGGILTLSRELQVLRERGARRVTPFLLPMMLADMASAKLSMLLGAQGPNFCTVSSCSSSADALGLAWQMVRTGEMDIAIAGGSEAPICPIAVAGFDAMRTLSRRNDAPQKASRPFDGQRDGFVMGEGAGVLIIESHESVLRRDVQPLAELTGYAATSDAYHVVEPAADGHSAARAIRMTLERAGLKPEDIGHINAHGTSTRLNDTVETKALKEALGQQTYHIPISSTKSMIGHLLGAAGAVEAVATIKALMHQVIPPTINLEVPDPECDLDYTANSARQAPVRAALSTSFGFGGHNSVLVFSAPNRG